MTMRGQRHSHKPQNGKRLLNLVILISLVCSTLLGCTHQITSIVPGPGREDWECRLSGQYYLIKANSSSKKICKATETDGLYENVLSYFYVTKYCVFEPFISLEGIPTEDIFASEEERASGNRQYYLLDVRNGDIYGPYDTTDALMESDLTKDIDILLVWETVPE